MLNTLILRYCTVILKVFYSCTFIKLNSNKIILMLLLQFIIAYPHLGLLGKFWLTSSLLYVWGLTKRAGISLTLNFVLKILTIPDRLKCHNLQYIYIYVYIYMKYFHLKKVIYNDAWRIEHFILKLVLWKHDPFRVICVSSVTKYVGLQ